jgi:hypothetical protein
MPHHSPEELEKFINRTLRSLPDRRAPRSLESRVLAAIAAQQHLPWWRQSFVHWPLAARAAFLIFTAVLAAAFVALSLRFAGGAQPAAMLAEPLEQLSLIRAVAGGIGDFFATVLRSIPSVWLYGAIAFVGVMYATLFGLGAAAYRAFFFQR